MKGDITLYYVIHNVFKCFVLENSKIKLKINDNRNRCASRIIMWSAALVDWIKTEERQKRVPLLFPLVSLSVPHRYDCDAIPTGVTAKEWISTGVTRTQQLFTLFGTESKIPSEIVKRTAVNLWLSSLHTVKLHGIIISRWESFLVF